MAQVIARLHELQQARDALAELLSKAPRHGRLAIIERLVALDEEIARGRELILRLGESFFARA